MTRPVDQTEFWRDRLLRAERMSERHRAVYECTLQQWQAIEEKHREILARCIGPRASILDVGCGWGRLPRLLPPTWEGLYIGIDSSPDFIALAREDWKNHDHRSRMLFYQCTIAEAHEWVDTSCAKMDWAVMVSFRPMIRRELGGEAWDKMEGEIRKLAKKLLYLEYDCEDPGSVE